MAANTSNSIPIFANAGNSLPVSLGTTANLTSDGSGTIVTLCTATTDGTRVEGVVITNAQATAAASSAMRINLYASDAAGANYRIIGQGLMATATRSNTVLGATLTITLTQPYIMKAGQLIGICQSVYAGVQDLNHAYPLANNY